MNSIDRHAQGTHHDPQGKDIETQHHSGVNACVPLHALALARRVFLSGCGLLPPPAEAGPSPADAMPTSHANPAKASGALLPPDNGFVPAWNGQVQWHVLDTGDRTGLNFLATWAAWRANPERPTRLFFTWLMASPCPAQDLLDCAAHAPDLQGPAAQLSAQWHTLLPGLHRLVFEGGAVQLTVCVGEAKPMLRELDVAADSVFLQALPPSPSEHAWDDTLLKAVTRLSRMGTALVSPTHTPQLQTQLQQCGYECLPPEPHAPGLAARYAPRWLPRHLQQLRRAHPATAQAHRHAVVIGAGISGSSVAHSLAVRGWHVTVLDAAAQPAAGASGLPAGLFAPHVSPDDGHLSQLTRSGLRSMRLRCESLLQREQDWHPTGVMELPIGRERRLPTAWRDTLHQPKPPHLGLSSSRLAQASDAPHWQADVQAVRDAGRLHGEPLWHAQAGWVRPAQLVRAQLQHPNIHWQGHTQVAALRPPTSAPHVASTHQACPEGAFASQWQVIDPHGDCLAHAHLVVLAAGPDTQALLQDWLPEGQFPTHAAQGMVSVGDASPPEPTRPPVNGHGSFLQGMPTGDGSHFWCAGASFLRNLPHGFDAATVAAEHAANTQRLRELLPSQGEHMAAAVAAGKVRHWHGTRCTVADRVPMVGPIAAGTAHPSPTAEPHRGSSPFIQAPPPLATAASSPPAEGSMDPERIAANTACELPWVSTAMGARGLTLGVLSGELLAAWLHGEPLPLAHSLAHKLRASRFAEKPKSERAPHALN